MDSKIGVNEGKKDVNPEVRGGVNVVGRQGNAGGKQHDDEDDYTLTEAAICRQRGCNRTLVVNSRIDLLLHGGWVVAQMIYVDLWIGD